MISSTTRPKTWIKNWPTNIRSDFSVTWNSVFYPFLPVLSFQLVLFFLLNSFCSQLVLFFLLIFSVLFTGRSGCSLGDNWRENAGNPQQTFGSSRPTRYRWRDYRLQNGRIRTCWHFQPSSSTVDGVTIYDWISAHEWTTSFSDIFTTVDNHGSDRKTGSEDRSWKWNCRWTIQRYQRCRQSSWTPSLGSESGKSHCSNQLKKISDMLFWGNWNGYGYNREGIVSSSEKMSFLEVLKANQKWIIRILGS